MIQWAILTDISSAVYLFVPPPRDHFANRSSLASQTRTPSLHQKPPAFLHTKMSSSRWPYRMATALLGLFALTSCVSALTIEYCSDINTSSNSKNISTYQSNGLCQQFCEADWAFAILQDNGCWCSNYAPATNQSGCDHDCPGYPDDKCGGSKLYGYIALNNAPSGTEGATGVSSTSASQSSSSDPSITQSSSSSTTWTPTPVISLQTVTGQVRTVTVTPTSPPSSQNTTTIGKSGNSSGLSTGAAVGLAIGLVVLIVIMCSLAYFCWRRRNGGGEKEFDGLVTPERRGSSAGIGGAPSRTMSENSRYVLGTDGRQVVETWEAGDGPGSRRSRLVPVDPRLDPFAPVYQRGAENKSRESINTIRDDHDYSRRVAHQGPILRATNPDTE